MHELIEVQLRITVHSLHHSMFVHVDNPALARQERQELAAEHRVVNILITCLKLNPVAECLLTRLFNDPSLAPLSAPASGADVRQTSLLESGVPGPRSEPGRPAFSGSTRTNTRNLIEHRIQFNVQSPCQSLKL